MANTDRRGTNLLPAEYAIDEAAAAESAGSTGESLALTVGSTNGESADFTYSATTEGTSLDNQPGVTANYPSTLTKMMRVKGSAAVDEGLGGSAEGVLVDVEVWDDEGELIVSSDEGPSDVHEGAVTFNLDANVPLQGGKALRLVISNPANESTTSDYDVAPGALDLTPAS